MKYVDNMEYNIIVHKSEWDDFTRYVLGAC